MAIARESSPVGDQRAKRTSMLALRLIRLLRLHLFDCQTGSWTSDGHHAFCDGSPVLFAQCMLDDSAQLRWPGGVVVTPAGGQGLPTCQSTVLRHLPSQSAGHSVILQFNQREHTCGSFHAGEYHVDFITFCFFFKLLSNNIVINFSAW